MMNWWCEKGIDGFRMDVISLLSKVQTFPDGEKGDGLYGNSDPYVCNGPRIHEFLQEMNREVLSKYDLITVGETSGVTVEQAKKYANLDGSELNMVFQFEHAFLNNGPYGKWTDNPVPLPELKEVLSKWQTELEGKAWTVFTGIITTSPERFPVRKRFAPIQRGIGQDARHMSAYDAGNPLYLSGGRTGNDEYLF